MKARRHSSLSQLRTVLCSDSPLPLSLISQPLPSVTERDSAEVVLRFEQLPS